MADQRQNNKPERPEADSPTGIQPEDVISGGPDDHDPVQKAYGRTGRSATTGVNGIPASDQDAGEERGERQAAPNRSRCQW